MSLAARNTAYHSKFPPSATPGKKFLGQNEIGFLGQKIVKPDQTGPCHLYSLSLLWSCGHSRYPSYQPDWFPFFRLKMKEGVDGFI